MSKYRQLVNRLSNVASAEGTLPGPDCPGEEDVNWYEVAAGLWPELKAKRLIMHAALCDHCGPLLRAATAVDDPTPQEERLLAQLNAPSQPVVNAQPEPMPPDAEPPPVWRRILQWKMVVPAVASLVIVAVLVRYQTAVITDATLWTKVCRIRRHDS